MSSCGFGSGIIFPDPEVNSLGIFFLLVVSLRYIHTLSFLLSSDIFRAVIVLLFLLSLEPDPNPILA